VEEQTTGWGRVDEDLLFDGDRYGLYARAHHIAGHHWGAAVAGIAGFPAGLDGRALPTPVRLDGCRNRVEALAVLIEALAIEAAVCAINAQGFGLRFDLDRTSVAEHVQATRRDAAERGCKSGGLVDRLLDHPDWTDRALPEVLEAWPGIVRLARALAEGQILEADEVAALLGREW